MLASLVSLTLLTSLASLVLDLLDRDVDIVAAWASVFVEGQERGCYHHHYSHHHHYHQLWYAGIISITDIITSLASLLVLDWLDRDVDTVVRIASGGTYTWWYDYW